MVRLWEEVGLIMYGSGNVIDIIPQKATNVFFLKSRSLSTVSGCSIIKPCRGRRCFAAHQYGNAELQGCTAAMADEITHYYMDKSISHYPL